MSVVTGHMNASLDLQKLHGQGKGGVGVGIIGVGAGAGKAERESVGHTEIYVEEDDNDDDALVDLCRASMTSRQSSIIANQLSRNSHI